MKKLIMTAIEKNGVRFNNARLQFVINWFYFTNIITIAILCFIILKLYKLLLLFYEWFCPFKIKLESPTILVIGPKNDLLIEIFNQLSKKFNSEVIEILDKNYNKPELSISKQKKSKIIYGNIALCSKEEITELSKYVQKKYGSVDILVAIQNENPLPHNSTQSFLNHLNRQLLSQFWTVMAFLPEMLRRNKGYIISIALGRSPLTNTGIMRSIHEELLQCDTKVKLTLVESNTFLDSYLPSLSNDLLARIIIRSMWIFDSVVKVPSVPTYVQMLPIKMNQSGSYSVSKKGQGNADNQYYLLSESSKNGPTVTPKSITRTGSDIINAAERQPFIERHSMEPVRLTPAWEDNNLSDDELNFKNLTMEQANLELNPPKDRYQIVFLILLLHGIGVLMPWNMFINAREYFVVYKMSKNYTGIESDYATYFLSYVGLASQIPNLLFSWINIFIRIGGNLTTRIVWSIFIEVVMIVFTVILAMTDTSEWPGIFFWNTMVIVIILNMAGGIYQNTVYGMAGKLPARYSGAIILGSNISGTFVSIIDIITVMIAPSKRTAAIYYFITSLFVLLACFDTYFALPLNRFYRYHEYLREKSEQIIRRENAGTRPKTSYWFIFKKAFPQLFNVFFVFFVTLSIFPTMQSGIKKSDPDFFISDKYFEKILCYLTFNTTAMLGSLVSNWIRWPSPKYLVVPVVLRALFIPFFIFCNFKPENVVRKLPVLITNDWGYWIAGTAMGFTSGYFSSIAMMYTSGSVESAHSSTASMFGGAIIITGIFFGVLFAMVFPWLVENVSI